MMPTDYTLQETVENLGALGRLIVVAAVLFIPCFVFYVVVLS